MILDNNDQTTPMPEPLKRTRVTRTAPAANPLEDAAQKDTLTSFQAKIDDAMLQGNEWVETSDDIINYYNKAGLKGQEYFIFRGIKVTQFGKSEDLDEKLRKSSFRLDV